MADESLDVNGAGLHFSASIEDDDYLKSIDTMLAANRRLFDAENKRLALLRATQGEVNDMLLSSGGLYSKLSTDAQQNLGALSVLQKQMQKVAEDKNKLNAAFAAGNTSQADYASNIRTLQEEEVRLAEAIAKVSQELTKSDSLQKVGNEIIETKRKQIEQLAAAYKSMDTATQNSDRGQAIQANIAGLKNDIESLDRAFKSITSNAFGNLAGEVKTLDAIQQRYTQIARLQNEIANVQVKKTELNTSFADNQKNAQKYRQELALLNEQEQALKIQIKATSESLKAKDAQLGQSQVQAEVKELEKLRAIYAKLAETELKTPTGQKVQADIARLEKTVQRGQDAETKILEERAAAAARLEAQYKELNKVKVEKTELKAANPDVSKYIKVYREELEKLNIQEKELTNSITRETAAVQQSEAVHKSISQAVAVRVARIAELKAAYDNLSTADQQAPEIGGKLTNDMDALARQIRNIQGMFTGLATDGGNALTQKTQAMRDQFAEISKLQFDSSGMLRQLTQLQTETTELKNNLSSMPSLTLEGIEASTNKINFLRASFDALSDTEKVSVIGQNTLSEINALEAELKQVDSILSNLPALTLGEIDAKKAQLVALNTELAKLNQDTNVDLNLTGKVEHEIKRINNEVEALENNLKTLPTLSIGNIQPLINNLNFLRKEFDSLSDLDKINPEIGGKMQSQIQALTANLDKFKAGLQDIPALTISGIEERVTQITKLQQQLNSLPENQKLTLGVTIQANIDQLTGEVDNLKKSLGTVPELELGKVAENTAKIVELEAATSKLKSNLTNFPAVAIQVQGVGELEKLIQQATEAKARLDALPEGEQIDINIVGRVKEELAQIDGQISSVIGKILNVPDLNLRLEDETAKLARLETQLESLSEAEIKSGVGEKLISDIDEAEAQVNLLKKSVATVPELTLGNVQEKINELVKLRNAVDGVEAPDPFTFTTGIKQEIDTSLKSLQELKTALQEIPDATVSGVTLENIDKNITELQKLKNEIAELDQVQAQRVNITSNYNEATGDAAAYQAELARLASAEERLTQSIANSTSALQGNATAQENTLKVLTEKEARIESLRLSYAQLSEAEQQTGKGLAITSEINALQKEVESLTASLQKVAIGNIDTSGIQKVKADFRELFLIQEKLAGVKTQKLQLETDYKAGAVDAKAYGDSLEALEKQENDLTQAYEKQSAELKKNNDFQKAGSGLIEAKTKELARLKSAYNNLPAASKLDVNLGGDLKNQINALEAELNQLKSILKTVDGGNFDKSVAEAQQFKKSIEQLQIEMQSYEAIVRKATDPAVIRKYTLEIERLEKEIRAVKNAGANGFDAMGRPLNSQLSILGRLEKAATLYKNAIQNATNPANIVKYNQKLEQTTREINRLQNAGKEGFDALGNSIGKSTNVAGKLFSGLKSIAAFLPGIGLIGLVDLVTEPLLEWVKNLDLFKAKIDEAKEARKSFNDVMVKGAQSAQQEITQLKTLFAVAKDTTISMEKRRDAVKALQDQYPDYLGNIKTEVILAGNAQAAYDKLSASILATGRARAAQDKITENASLRLDNEQKLIDLQEEQIKNEEKLAEAIRFRAEAGKGSSTSITGAGAGGNVVAETEVYLAQKRIEDNLKEQTKIKKDNTRLDKEALRLAGEINNQVKKGADLTPDKDSKGIDDYLKRYEDMMQRIQALKDKYEVKNLSPDEAARKALNDEFKKIAFDVAQFNRDPKNKIKIVAPIEDLRKKAEAQLIYRQETEKLKIETERQKQIFSEYENYKTALGKEKAEERFRGEKAEFDSYKDFLISRIREITSLGIPADKMNGDMRARLENFTKALEDVNKADQASYDKFYTDLAQAAQTYYQKLALIDAEYRKKEEQLRERSSGPDLDRELQELERQKAERIDIAKDEAFQKTKIYEKLNQAVIRYTKDQARAQIEATKAALKNADISGTLREQLETELDDFELVLNVGVDESYIQKLQERKKLLEDSLLNEKLSTAEIKQQRQELAEVNQTLESIDLTWQKLFGIKKIDSLEDAAGQANLLRNTVAQISQGFRAAANSVREMNGALADSLDTAAEIGDIATDYFSAGASILSGDFGGALQSTLSYLQKAFDFVFSAPKRTAQEAKRQIEEYNRQQYDAQFEINQLYRERLRVQQDINAETMSGLREQARFLNEQASKATQDYQKVLEELQKQQYVSGQKTEKYGGILGIGQKTRVVDVMSSLRGLSYDAIEELFLAGKLSERAQELFKILQKLKEEGADIDALLEENRKKAQEIALGISSDAFVDAFANLFQKGKPSIEQLGEFFEETMANAALSIFKSEYLNQAMQQFYKAFAAAATEDSEAGIAITEAEKERLRELYNNLAQDAIDVYEDLLDITGNTKAPGSTEDKNSLKGDINRMTEETATVLAGQLGGMRLGILDISETAKQILAAILSPGTVNLPGAGNNTFSVPGMLEVAENSRIQTGYQQTLVIDGKEQIRLMTMHLDYARRTADSNDKIEINTRAITKMATTLEKIERNQASGSNALRANGAG